MIVVTISGEDPVEDFISDLTFPQVPLTEKLASLLKTSCKHASLLQADPINYVYILGRNSTHRCRIACCIVCWISVHDRRVSLHSFCHFVRLFLPRYIAAGNEATRCDDSAVIDLGASSAQVLAGPHQAAVAARENAR